MNMSSFEHGVIGLITLALIVGRIYLGGAQSLSLLQNGFVTACLTLATHCPGCIVRLSDAGLGCPDWPGCYGNLTPAHSTEEIKAAESVQTRGPVSMAKAWKEMTHRYPGDAGRRTHCRDQFSAWRNRAAWRQSPVLPTLLAGGGHFPGRTGRMDRHHAA